jgi:hypothetical protein
LKFSFQAATPETFGHTLVHIPESTYPKTEERVISEFHHYEVFLHSSMGSLLFAQNIFFKNLQIYSVAEFDVITKKQVGVGCSPE